MPQTDNGVRLRMPVLFQRIRFLIRNQIDGDEGLRGFVSPNFYNNEGEHNVY
jgi:hypothetical protein